MDCLLRVRRRRCCGVYEGKNKQIPLGCGRKLWCNEGMEVDGPSVSMETACCQLIAQGSACDSNILRIERTPAIAKSWVSNEVK